MDAYVPIGALHPSMASILVSSFIRHHGFRSLSYIYSWVTSDESHLSTLCPFYANLERLRARKSRAQSAEPLPCPCSIKSTSHLSSQLEELELVNIYGLTMHRELLDQTYVNRLQPGLGCWLCCISWDRDIWGDYLCVIIGPRSCMS